MYTYYNNDFLNTYIYIKTVSSYAVLHHICFKEERGYLFNNYVKHFNKIISKNVTIFFSEWKKRLYVAYVKNRLIAMQVHYKQLGLNGLFKLMRIYKMDLQIEYTEKHYQFRFMREVDVVT